MNDVKPVWLPHFSNEVAAGVRKTKQCSYAIALEGWRRGLTLRWYTADSDKFSDFITSGDDPFGRLFSLSSNERTHYFFRTRGDKVTNEAVEAGISKEETKIHLSKAGVPVPKGKVFKLNDEDNIAKYSSVINFPVVLKPVDGSMGEGVFTNIKDKVTLQETLENVRREFDFDEVIIEQYISGKEFRLYVVDGKVVGAYNRLPANVMGDGKSTLKKLIKIKNKQRKKNPRLATSLIKIDQDLINYIESTGYSIDDIPSKGETVFLREKSNVSLGGDPVDVTDELPNEIKQLAIDAIRAIPGLHHGGVDIIWDRSNSRENNAVVIELNPTAQIGGILFPIKGYARDIPSAIVDFYFPETIGTEKSSLYFDFHEVMDPFITRSAIEVEVSPTLRGKILAKKYKLSGEYKGMKYLNWIKGQAFKLNLQGSAKLIDDRHLEIIVAGTNPKEVDQFKEIINKQQELAQVGNISEEVWEKPVKVGFEVFDQFNLKQTDDDEVRLQEVKRRKKKLLKEKKRVEHNYKMIQKSTVWKVSWPIRKVIGVLRYVKRYLTV